MATKFNSIDDVNQSIVYKWSKVFYVMFRLHVYPQFFFINLLFLRDDLIFHRYLNKFFLFIKNIFFFFLSSIYISRSQQTMYIIDIFQ